MSVHGFSPTFNVQEEEWWQSLWEDTDGGRTWSLFAASRPMTVNSKLTFPSSLATPRSCFASKAFFC